MVQRRHFENAPSYAVLLLGVLEVGHLNHHRNGFSDEHPAHDGQHDFLADDHGDGAQGAAQRQRAHVAHEHLRRIGVEPQKRQPGADHRAHENQQLPRSRNEGEQQIFGIHRIAGDIGKHAQRAADHDHGHDGQAIGAVGEVDRVAAAHDDQIAQHDEAGHAQRITDRFEERHDEVGSGGQGHAHAALQPRHEQMPDLGVALTRHGESQVERGGHADERLPEVLVARAHAVGVAVDHLAVIVGPADGAETQRDQQHQPDEAVAQIHPQQGGHADGQQDEHPAHGGRAGLDEMRLRPVLTHGLADLHRGEFADDCRAREQADEQRGERAHHRTESDVVEHPKKAQIGRELHQPHGQTMQHGAPPAWTRRCHSPPARRWPAPRAPCA